jgi:hypothetical protein
MRARQITKTVALKTDSQSNKTQAVTDRAGQL